MPATRARSRPSNGKRARNSEDDAERNDKRPRGAGNPNDIHQLRDRTRLSWQNKGKWRERTPKRNMMSLAQAATDLFAPGTSKQGATINEMLAPLDTEVSAQSPSSPKDVPLPETPATNGREQQLQAEIEQLRSQLKQKDQVISRHENTLEVVQNSMNCPVCLDPLWKPFVVVPCGHIACQSCLINWFTSPPPDPNGAAPAPLPPHRQKQKRKTCPHCRGVVRSRPVEVYGLGPVVATLVGQPAPASPPKANAPNDPWENMFPPPSVGPMRDEEDGGIMRCPACLHELWDGECTHCGRVFSDGTGDSAFGSDDSISVYGEGLASIYNSDDDESVYGLDPQPAYVPRRAYDSYDEDEDEDDSFIDDSEFPRPPPAAYFHHYVPSDSEEDEDEAEVVAYHSAGGDGYRSPVPTVIRVASSSSNEDSDTGSSEDDDEEEDDFLPPRGRRGRSAETLSTIAPETAEEADDEDEDDEVNPNATIDLASDESDDEAPIRATGRRSAATRWGWTPEDGEPPRGRSLSRRRVVSPEAESEDGSEYFSD